MRWPIIAVLALLCAGCLAPAAPTSTKAATPAALGGWTLDCAMGSAVPETWHQRCEARGSSTPGSKTETWIAINPTDVNNVIVASKDLTPAASDKCVWNGLAVTHDGGKSWRDVTIGGKFVDRKPDSPYYGYACNTDPDFQFTKDGAVHYGVEMYGGDCPDPVCQNTHNWKVVLATSHDGGDTWPDAITFHPDLVATTDFSRMTVDPVTQAIIEAIGADGAFGCHVIVSKDGGKSAQPPVEVLNSQGPACGAGADTAIAASPKGTIVLLGGIVGSATGQTSIARSTDDGATWVDFNPGFTYKPISQLSDSAYRTPGVIELAYDKSDGPNKGTLYATYPASDRDEADVYARASKDDGKTWGDAVRVNDDAAGAHQWMSNVGVAGDGSVHVFFMDKRYDPQHKLIDLTHAVSFDAGKTWKNERVSTVSFDGALGKHQDGPPFIGDYLGVACVANDCWAGFPDTSPGDTASIAAAHVHHG